MTSIRLETPNDYPHVREVNTLAFERPEEAVLVEALRKRDGTISLVAEQQNQLVGHICFSTGTIQGDSSQYPVINLAPMAVLPEFQGQGIGSKLVISGLEVCRNAGHQIVAVLGHPWFYPKFGFLPAANFGIQSPYPVPDEVFMISELVEGAAQFVSGILQYPPEFDLVD